MAGNAIIEAPVAASDPGDAPPFETEIAPAAELTEIDAPELTESEEPDDDPYAGLTPREAAEKVREEERKAAEASRKEALRVQREQIDSEQKRIAAQNAAAMALRQNAEKATAESRARALGRVKAFINGDAEGSDDDLAALVADLDTGARYQSLQAFDQATGAYMREFGVADMHPEVKVGYLQAAARGDVLGMLKAVAETARGLGWQQAQQFAQSTQQNTAAQQAQEAAAANGLRETRARNAGAAQPTNVRGPATRGVDHDAVLKSAHPLSPEYARAFKAKHGFDAPKP